MLPWALAASADRSQLQAPAQPQTQPPLRAPAPTFQASQPAVGAVGACPMVLMVPAAPGCRPRTGVHSVALPGVYFPGALVPATLRSWVLPMAEVGFVIEARVVRVPVGRVAPGRWVGWQVGHRLVVQVVPKCWLQIRQGWRRWAAGWAGQEGWGRPQKHHLQERQRCLVCALQSRIPVHRRVARVRPRCLLGLQARVAQGVRAPARAAQVVWMAWLPVPPPPQATVRARAPHARPPPD